MDRSEDGTVGSGVRNCVLGVSGAGNICGFGVFGVVSRCGFGVF